MSKKKISYVKKNVTNSEPKVNKLYMFPLMMLLGVIPFIVRYKSYKPRLSFNNWFFTDEYKFDFFLYYKQIFIIITCSIMLLMVIYKIYRDKKDISFSPILIPLSVYGILAFLSTVFSEHASFGFTGIYEQFESVFVLLGYCLIVYYAYLFIESEEDVKYIMKFFLYCVIILGVLGVFQATGHDFFSSDIGLRTILPRALWESAGDFEFKFGKYCSYLSFYNPNYVGVYVAMTAPIFVCICLMVKDKKIKILSLIAVIGLLISLYGSKSKAGIIGVLGAVILCIVFLRKYIFRKPKIVLPILAVGIVATTLVISMKWSTITERVTDVLKPVKTEATLTDIKTEEDITITYKGNELHVANAPQEDGSISFSVTDGNNQEISLIQNTENNTFVLQDERFQNISINPYYYNNNLITDINIDGTQWLFIYNSQDKEYYYVNGYGRLDKIKMAESAIFTGYESFATGRGYLWSRTIPLLKDNIILGSGADTFILEFPQQDYVHMNNSGFGTELITKPHSYFLQIGVQTGVLSLVAFLVFYGMYFISSVYLYMKGKFDDVFSQVGVAIFIGTVGFMITGISNDSCIAVTPVFWTLLGIGIAANHKVKLMRKTIRQDK